MQCKVGDSCEYTVGCSQNTVDCSIMSSADFKEFKVKDPNVSRTNTTKGQKAFCLASFYDRSAASSGSAAGALAGPVAGAVGGAVLVAAVLAAVVVLVVKPRRDLARAMRGDAGKDDDFVTNPTYKSPSAPYAGSAASPGKPMYVWNTPAGYSSTADEAAAAPSTPASSANNKGVANPMYAVTSFSPTSYYIPDESGAMYATVQGGPPPETPPSYLHTTAAGGDSIANPMYLIPTEVSPFSRARNNSFV